MPTSLNTRRNFIKTSLFASAGMSSVIASGQSRHDLKKPTLPQELTVVFQGDSITDYGRNRKSTDANDFKNIGNGYVNLSAAQLVGENPQTSWKYYNRGISGNKVHQLAERWDKDCLDLTPDVVSILIGVNDFWHIKKHGYSGTVKVYEDDLKALLDRTIKARPNVKFIIGQPFFLEEGSAIDMEEWFPAFTQYQKAAKKIADEYNTAWVPYQEVFDEALKKAPHTYWSWDGIHPSFAGCYIMAKAWIKAFDGLFV
ncbi:MAG: lysophospholipase [Phycisphaeraceae bacterium]|nr:lysophospholipase [Phycisphaeraceae bacterium]